MQPLGQMRIGRLAVRSSKWQAQGWADFVNRQTWDGLAPVMFHQFSAGNVASVGFWLSLSEVPTLKRNSSLQSWDIPPLWHRLSRLFKQKRFTEVWVKLLGIRHVFYLEFLKSFCFSIFYSCFPGLPWKFWARAWGKVLKRLLIPILIVKKSWQKIKMKKRCKKSRWKIKLFQFARVWVGPRLCAKRLVGSLWVRGGETSETKQHETWHEISGESIRSASDRKNGKKRWLDPVMSALASRKTIKRWGRDFHGNPVTKLSERCKKSGAIDHVLCELCQWCQCEIHLVIHLWFCGFAKFS